MSMSARSSGSGASLRLSIGTGGGSASDSLSASSRADQLASLALSPRVIDLGKKSNRSRTKSDAGASSADRRGVSPRTPTSPKSKSPPWGRSRGTTSLESSFDGSCSVGASSSNGSGSSLTTSTTTSSTTASGGVAANSKLEPALPDDPLTQQKKKFTSTSLKYLLEFSGLSKHDVTAVLDEVQRRSKTTKRKAQLPPDNSGLTGREGDLLHKIEREIIRLQSFARDTHAATRIQSVFRGWRVRKALASYRNQTPENRTAIAEFNRRFFDLVSKESAYIVGLQLAVQEYLRTAVLEGIISDKDRELVFCNIERVVAAHKKGQQMLEALLNKWPIITGVGQALLDIAPTLSEYGVYVGNFKNCNSTLLRLKEENSAFTALVQRVDRTQGASLSALLSQPVNHISKLCTDIEQLANVAIPGSREAEDLARAFELFTQAGIRVKQSLIGGDSSESLLHIERQIISPEPLNLVKPNRMLVCQGELRLESGKKPLRVVVFLFNDLLLVTTHQDSKTKRAKTDNFVFKQKIPLDAHSVLTPGSTDCSFKIKDANQQSYTFIAKSVESKDQWLNSIQAQLSRLGSMKVFGASLTTLLKKEDRLDSIPKIVELCVAAIRARPDGMKTEGLFRVSPPKRELDQLRAQFDLSDGNSSIDLKDYNTHVIGGVLLQWLQELPEPLLGFEFYENLLAALDAQETTDELVDHMKEWMNRLYESSPGAARTAKVLFSFWSEIPIYYASNKMNMANLAIVIAPNILRPRVDTIQTALRSPLLTQGVQTLIEHYATVFQKIAVARTSNEPTNMFVCFT